MLDGKRSRGNLSGCLGWCGPGPVRWSGAHLRGWWMCWLMWWAGGSFCTEGTGFWWATWAAAGVKSLSPWKEQPTAIKLFIMHIKSCQFILNSFQNTLESWNYKCKKAASWCPVRTQIPRSKKARATNVLQHPFNRVTYERTDKWSFWRRLQGRQGQNCSISILFTK